MAKIIVGYAITTQHITATISGDYVQILYNQSIHEMP